MNNYEAAPSSVRNRRQSSDNGRGKRIVKGFRFNTGRSKSKDVKRVVQGKRNAKRGMAKRIRSAKRFHKSLAGRNMHKSQGRANRGRTSPNENTPTGVVSLFRFTESLEFAPATNVAAAREWFETGKISGYCVLSEGHLRVNYICGNGVDNAIAESLGFAEVDTVVHNCTSRMAIYESAIQSIDGRAKRICNGGWLRMNEQTLFITKALPNRQYIIESAIPVPTEVAQNKRTLAVQNFAHILRDTRKDLYVGATPFVVEDDNGVRSGTGSIFLYESHGSPRAYLRFDDVLRLNEGAWFGLDFRVDGDVRRAVKTALRDCTRGIRPLRESVYYMPKHGMFTEEGDTVDSRFDNVLAMLVVRGFLDGLQDVNYEEEYGSIFLYFDPVMERQEIDDIIIHVGAEYQNTQLVGTPDKSLPDEIEPADWWVVWVPASPDAPLVAPYTTEEALLSSPEAVAEVMPLVQAAMSGVNVSNAVDKALGGKHE